MNVVEIDSSTACSESENLRIQFKKTADSPLMVILIGTLKYRSPLYDTGMSFQPEIGIRIPIQSSFDQYALCLQSFLKRFRKSFYVAARQDREIPPTPAGIWFWKYG